MDGSKNGYGLATLRGVCLWYIKYWGWKCALLLNTVRIQMVICCSRSLIQSWPSIKNQRWDEACISSVTGFVNSQVLCCCPRAIKEGNRTNKNRESYLDLEIFASVLSLYAMAIRGPLSFHLWISVSLMLLMYGDCFYLPGVAPEDFKKVRFCCWLSTF